MNKLIGIAAILTMAMFASGALADNYNVQAYETVTARTCALQVTTTNNYIDFGTMLSPLVDTATGYQEVDLYNGGTVPTTSLTVQGTDWSSGSPNWHTMSVGQTKVQDDGTNCAAPFSCSLPASAGQIFGNSIANGATKQSYFELVVPAGQIADSYQQTITFSAGC